MARNKEAVAVDFLRRDEAESWLESQPREVCVTLASRAALRVLPLVVSLRNERDFIDSLVLSIFRAAVVLWARVKYPAHSAKLRDFAADAATTAARGAARGERDAAYAFAAAAGAARAIVHGAYAAEAAAALDAATYAAAASSIPSDSELRGAAAGAAIAADATALIGESARARSTLADTKLWQRESPNWADAAWTALKMILSTSGENWEVWTDWYEDRLVGRLSLGEGFDIAIATLPDEIWGQGPGAVNAEIKRLTEEYAAVEPIPAQGPGPHFALNADLKITRAPPEAVDAAGNNIERIGQILPLVRQAAVDLAGHLNPNSQPEIARSLADYRNAIAGEPTSIAWGVVFGLGVRLDNAATAARRQIEDRMHPPLEDAAQEALNTVLSLHGPMILATTEGRELSDDADRFRLTRDERLALREDARAIAQSLKNTPEIIEPTAARLGEEAADAIGEGPHPQRGAAYWLATAKNVATILVPAGALGALAWTIGGVGENAVLLTSALLFHENERFRDAARAIGTDYHRVIDTALDTAADQTDLAKAQAIAQLRLLTPFREFITANEKPLRRIAAYSTNLRWMLWYMDFIRRTNGNRK